MADADLGRPEDLDLVRPRLDVLSEGQIERIHDYSLRILSTSGVRVDSERARQLFAKADGGAVIDGDRVRMTRDLHRRMAKCAEREGAPLSQFVLRAIAERVKASR